MEQTDLINEHQNDDTLEPSASIPTVEQSNPVLSNLVVGKLFLFPFIVLLFAFLFHLTDPEESSLAVNLLGGLLFTVGFYGVYELLGFAFGWVVGQTPLSANRRSLKAQQKALKKAQLTARVGKFRAGSAILVLGCYVASQLLVWIALGITLSIAGQEPSEENLQQLAVPGILMSLLGAGAVAAIVYLWLAARDNSPSGPLHAAIGFRRSPTKYYLFAAIVGLVIGIDVMLLGSVVPLPDSYTPDVFHRAAEAEGLPRLTWVFAAMMLAPPIEEFLFRGVLLEGLRRSWGIWAAGSITTVLFVCMHLPHALLYWPAGLGLTIGALFMLFVRMRSGSLGPAVTLHFCYNSVIAIPVLLSGG